MNLGNITLDEWLKKPPVKSLKRGGDAFPFHSKYETFKHYLDENLHKEITKKAIYEDIRKGKSPDTIIWLNDHGPEHIKTVIERASQLLDNGDKINLWAREVFFLLNSIQVHDIGNFYGRIGHEKHVLTAIRDGLTPILFDSREAKYIETIAQVHGGKIIYKDGREDKATIKTIKPDVTCDGYPIRLQLLASILRFADELADDKHRADVATLNAGAGAMPKGSEVFHAYAACLDTVNVNHAEKSVELYFKVPDNYLARTFGKIQSDDTISDVFLIEEIFNRTLKMHYERIYCSKYWKGLIDIERIEVEIEFYSAGKPEGEIDKDAFVITDITYTLKDEEYPSGTLNIYEICPSLRFSNGDLYDGINFKKRVEKNVKQ